MTPTPPADTSPLVSIVVIHWNDPARFRDALEFLERSTVAIRLIVVDNGSEAANVTELRRHLNQTPLETILLEPGNNLGFGPGANVGVRHWLRHDSTEWVGVMPHDAQVDPDCLAKMLAVVDHRPEVGLACADVGDGCTPVIDPYLGGLVLPSEVTEGWESAAYPHGTLMLARRACAFEVALPDDTLFDERYFAYVEEADLGIRARDIGWEIGIVRGAEVHNPFMGPGQAARDYLQQRNTMLLVRERSGWWPGVFRFWATAFQLAQGLVRPAVRPPMYVARARVYALAHHLQRRYGPPPPHLF